MRARRITKFEIISFVDPCGVMRWVSLPACTRAHVKPQMMLQDIFDQQGFYEREVPDAGPQLLRRLGMLIG